MYRWALLLNDQTCGIEMSVIEIKLFYCVFVVGMACHITCSTRTP